MNLSPLKLEMLVKRVWPKVKITQVFHPRVTPRLINMPNGVNLRFERGPFGYVTADGNRYPPVSDR